MATTPRTPKVISVRNDSEFFAALEALRRQGKPIPSQSDIIRRAVLELYAREVKPNGHRQRPRNGNRGTDRV